MNHLESKTAIISLFEFCCAHRFYNVDNTCNTLEFFVQYTNSSGTLLPGQSILITIPNGFYTKTSLLARINLTIAQTCL